MTVEELIKDRMFISMLLLDPEHAIKAFGLNLPDDLAIALKNIVDDHYNQMQGAIDQLSQTKANVCGAGCG